MPEYGAWLDWLGHLVVLIVKTRAKHESACADY